MANFFKYAAVFVAGMGAGAAAKYGYDKYHEDSTSEADSTEVEMEDPRDDIGDPPEVEE